MTCTALAATFNPATFTRHIRNDVVWFTRAVGNYERWFGNDDTYPPNTIVAYLDSALIHGRALVEFFRHLPSVKYPDVRVCHYLYPRSAFQCLGSTDQTLEDWKIAADTYLAHLTLNRDTRSHPPGTVQQVRGKSGPLNRWQLLNLWQQVLKPRFEVVAKSAFDATARAQLADLLTEADTILTDCASWNAP